MESGGILHNDINNPVYFINRTISFSVPGKPVGKQRPRATRYGGIIKIYTPRETKNYEEKIKQEYLNTVGDIKLEGALQAKVLGIFPIPSSCNKNTKSKMINGEIYHTKKPDCDNMGKTVFDGLNTVAYDDDSQICKTQLDKMYGEEPKLEVTLSELNKLNRKEKEKCVTFQMYPTTPIYFTN